MKRRNATIAIVVSVITAAAMFGAPSSVGAASKTSLIIQGGTTPVDSGLYQNVIFPLFTKQYPQYDLQYVSVGTAQAIANAEAGQGDAVFTHSPAAENAFVSQGYSYESGGRLVMASDFVTVGAKSDPAGAVSAGDHNAVGAFKAIAAAGNAGTADFVSRGDGSGTNKGELAIWALTGIPLNGAGEPTGSWYHKSGLGQAQNLQITNQCPFSSGDCYTYADSGTFNYLSGNGSVPDLAIVSRYNDSPNAKGGVGLLLNPYHVYAVNPAKVPSANVNLAGALAFLNFMTEPSTQTAIGNYPNAKAPAFYPDARPNVKMLTNLPAKANTGATLTIVGTVTPSYYLDPAINNVPVFLEREHAPGVVLASTTLATSKTAFQLTFKPTVSDTYDIVVPSVADSMILPTNSGVRQPTTVAIRKMSVASAVSLAVTPKSGLSVTASGRARPVTDRHAAKVQVQYKSGSKWVNAGKAIAMPNGTSTFSKVVTLPRAGTWSLRAHYTDSGIVVDSYSQTRSVKVS
jgi:tungstate transport system substrate-binding protein